MKLPSNSPDLYFYADDNEAKIFDAVAPFTCIGYSALHAEFVRAIRLVVGQRKSKPLEFVVDIGSGTGLPLLPLLQNSPGTRALAIDCSAAMLAILRGKLAVDKSESRVRILEEPIQKAHLDSLESLFDCSCGDVGLVTSCYALHHLTPESKLSVYKSIAKRLGPGGVFLNGDLFAHADEATSQFMQHEEEIYLNRAVSENWCQIYGESITGQSAQQVIEDWIDHLQNANLPLPINNSNREVECRVCEESLLFDAGFTKVETIFRLAQSGIIMAFK